MPFSRKIKTAVKLVDPDHGAAPYRVEIWIDGKLDMTFQFENKQHAIDCYDKHRSEIL